MPVTFSEVMSRLPLRRFQIITFIICVVVLVADGMDAQLLGIVAPIVIEEFGIDRGSFGIAISAALVGFGLGSWAGGWLGDRAGRRYSLAIAAAVFSLATIAASTAQDVWSMALWRVIGGLGFGSAYANAITMVGEWLPDRWKYVGVTTISVGTPAGGMVVAALAPTLIGLYEWRGTFVFLGIATFLVVILIMLLLRDSPSFLMARGKREEAHQAAKILTDETLQLVPERHQTDSGTEEVGVLHRSNFRMNLGIGIAFTSATMVAYGILSWTTTLLTAKNFSFDQAAYAVSIAGLTSIFASIAAGVLVRRFGSRLVMSTLSFSLLVTLLLLTASVEALSATPADGERMLVVVLIGLAGALFSACIASIYAMMTYGYPPSCRSAGIGFGIFMGRIGAIGSTAFGGWLLDVGAGSSIPFFAVLCVGSVLVSCAAFIVDRQVPPFAKV
jgi:AAHS family 4-hydroxybenzoate transporter-like MFS transporter